MSRTEEESIMATLEELEERILEQEHRPVVAIKNFLYQRHKYPAGDSRRKAIVFALVWALLFSPGGVAVVGGGVAVVSVGMLVWQNFLIQQSNTLLLEQIRAEERVSLQSQRLQAMRDLYGKESAGMRSEAFLTLITITERLHELSPKSTHLIRRDLQNANLEGAVLDYREINAFDLTGASLQNASIRAGVVQNCIFNDADFDGATLSSGFIGCAFEHLLKGGKKASFAEASFKDCSFTSTSLSALPSLQGAQFVSCKFVDCELSPESLFFKCANVSGNTKFVRVKGLSKEEQKQFEARTGAVFVEESWD